MAIKVDLEKAYDKIRWEFIEDSLRDLELPQQIIRLIMECVSTTSMQIAWNGALMEEFRPERGIRQDDLVLFSRADCSNAAAIRELLDQYSQYSGHRVSINKTQLFFSPNTDAETAMKIESILHFKVVDNLGMYLGIPIIHGRATYANFRYIIDKVRRRLNGWSVSSLSMAGRVTLAKAVISAIPDYCMQVVMLPANVIDEIEKLIRCFVCGDSEQQPKLSLVNWKTVCKPMCSGGLVNDLPVDVDTSVATMVDDHGEWNWPRFEDLISHGTCSKIASISPPVAEASPDVCTWRWASNGKFSIGGAYGCQGPEMGCDMGFQRAPKS
ncbi:hypothetical protein AAHA92_00650 [Salvia divinorum]|uniref:Reverse transcriptase n=1 Tax=Salvia divinorum TaxID=28513 RepID=A0ABD1ING9_SALDI